MTFLAGVLIGFIAAIVLESLHSPYEYTYVC